MYEVRVRPGKNRLYFTMRGAVTEEEARAAAEELTRQLPQLRAGFDTITDINGLEPLSPDALAQIKRGNDQLMRVKPGRVIRVVGRSALAAVQFEKLSKAHGHSAQLAFSLEEAERLLDGLPDDLAL